MKLWIRSGLRSFGLEGADWEAITAPTFEDGRAKAKELARQEYDQYAGVVGLRTLDQIIGEDLVTLADAEVIYKKEREDQILYEVKTYDPNGNQNDLFEESPKGHYSAFLGMDDDDPDNPWGNYYSGYADDGDDFSPEIEAEIKAEEEAERLFGKGKSHHHEAT